MKRLLPTVLLAAVVAFSSASGQTETDETTLVASPSSAPITASNTKPEQCTDCSDCHGDEGTALRKLEQEWADAVAKHDAAAIDRIEAKDFVATDPSGAVSHKEEDLAMAKSGELNISNFQLADMKVSVYGDAAVVTGKTTFRANVGEEPLGGDYHWTDVFVRRDGKWQVVASQATNIAPPRAEKTAE